MTIAITGVSLQQLILETVPPILCSLLVESLLFGIHIVLFGICAYLLAIRQNPAHLFVLLSITAMFAISVADMTVVYRWVFHDYVAVLKGQMGPAAAVDQIRPIGYLYVTNNLFADGLLIYRCYKVWNNQRMIPIVAGVLLAADSVWGYIAIRFLDISSFALATFTPLFLWSVFAFNVVMTLATAGRIWWVTRTSHLLLDKQQMKKYRTAITVILESGAIYPITVLIFNVSPSNLKIYFFLAATRVVGIMPTLMIVQIQASQAASTRLLEREGSDTLSPLSSDTFCTNPPSQVADVSLAPSASHLPAYQLRATSG
ncbi:hypothetical protein E4T56_gene6281 [Termitomyces sp. T112]|nr:hypothetical protein E4T56_gene6281 [Termitomyces sp. T112]